MSTRLFCLTALLAGALGAAVQSSQAQDVYHYWYDNATDQLESTSQPPASLDCSTMSPGLHAVHFFAERNGVASAVKSSCFLRITEPEGEKPDGPVTYRYWLDNNTADLRSSATPFTTLDLASLTPGLHAVHFFAERNGVASAVKSSCFLRITEPEGETPDGPVTYRYWLDNNTADLRSSATPFTTLDFASLTPGLHAVHFFAERNGVASAVKSSCFLRITEPEGEKPDGPITYRYWLDNNTADLRSSSTPFTTLDFASLTPGLHAVHFFAERNGVASAVKSSCFLRITEPEEIKNHDEYNMIVMVDGEYLDNIKVKSAEVIKVPVEMPEVAKGLHKISVALATDDGYASQWFSSEFYHGGIAERGSYSVALRDSEGNDVTSEAAIIWRDLSGRIIATAPRLTGIVPGDTVTYSIQLPEELARIYREQRRVPVIVESGNHDLSVELESFAYSEYIGTVADADGIPAAGACVTAVQYLNGLWPVTVTATTDAEGRYTMRLTEAPTRFDVAAKGFVSGSKVIDDFTPEISVAAITLTLAGNMSIVPAIEYLRATVAGPEAIRGSTVGGNDISCTVSSADDGTVIIAATLADGAIILPREVEPGRRLRLTFRSATEAFAETVAEVTVADSTVTTLNVTLAERGGITSRHNATGAFTARLYDANGRYVGASAYGSQSEASFSALADGDYSIVSIADNLGVESLGSLDDYNRLGLRQGTDFGLCRATVTAGYITEVTAGTIPAPSSSPISALVVDAALGVNKNPVIADEMLTASLHLNLDSALLAGVSSGEVIFTLPAGCVYEDGSMMAGGKIRSASVNDGRISVALDSTELASRIRFCLRSAKGGIHRINAILRLNVGSGSVTCPAGLTAFTVSDYELNVPEKTASRDVNVRGTSAPFGNVEVFDGETMLTAIRADGFGHWNTAIELPGDKSVETHSLWMRTQGLDGFTFTSMPRYCLYDENLIVPRSVTMLNTGWRRGSLQTSVIPLDGSKPKGRLSYDYSPSYPIFTFLADFNRNDPDVVSAVEVIAFTQKGMSVRLPAEWNEKRQCWVATHKFSSSNLPVNAKIDYVLDYDTPLDTTVIDRAMAELMVEDDMLVELDSLFARADSLALNPEIDSDSLEMVYNAIDIRMATVIHSGVDRELDDLLRRLEAANTIEELEAIDKEFSEGIGKNGPETGSFKDYNDPTGNMGSFNNDNDKGVPKVKVNNPTPHDSIPTGPTPPGKVPPFKPTNDSKNPNGVVSLTSSNGGTITYDVSGVVGSGPSDDDNAHDYLMGISKDMIDVADSVSEIIEDAETLYIGTCWLN